VLKVEQSGAEPCFIAVGTTVRIRFAPPVSPFSPVPSIAAGAKPGIRVVSREFSEELGGCLVVEASQAGAIVVGDEGVEVGVAFIVVAKAAMVGDMVLRHPVEMLAEAAVEALDHAVIRHDDFGAPVFALP
jgi:hypothetical protein